MLFLQTTIDTNSLTINGKTKENNNNRALLLNREFVEFYAQGVIVLVVAAPSLCGLYPNRKFYFVVLMDENRK